MELKSMLRTVVGYFSNGKLCRKVRPASPRVESLEAREVMTAGVLATATILTPQDGLSPALPSGVTSFIVRYSEDVTGANSADSYLLLDSAGNEVPLDDPTYDPNNFQATFTPAQINNNVALPLGTYTLLVRRDRITDVDDAAPLAGPNQLVVSSGPRQTVSPVQVSGGGTLGAISNYPVAQVGSTAPSPTDVATGDFDNDGLADLVVVNAGTGTVNVHLGRPASQGGGYAVRPDVTLLLPIGAGTAGKDVLVGQFDDDDGVNEAGDGDLPDIVVLNRDDNSLSFFRNTGGTSGSVSFASAVTIAGLNDPTELASADFDGDQYPDLVVANAGNG
ncbi:MAG: FG-GAP repeat domain-containing protein, partial [Gemmataceae bacterium]